MAVSYQYLVDDLVKRVNFAITGSTTVDDALDTDIRWALEAAQLEFVQTTKPDDFVTTGTVTTANGTAEYDLPDDFREMRPNGVRLAASPYTTLQYLSKTEFQRYQFHSLTGASTPYAYTLLSRSASTAVFTIRFLPIPDATLSIKVDYNALPTRIATTTLAGGSYVDRRLPPALIHALIYRAALHFPQLLQPSQLNSYAEMWMKAMSMARESAIKQEGVLATPADYDPRMDTAFVAPITLT